MAGCHSKNISRHFKERERKKHGLRDKKKIGRYTDIHKENRQTNRNKRGYIELEINRFPNKNTGQINVLSLYCK